ncbi:MAG: glutathione S-transferase, partial [Pseudomonadota bacterium]
RAYSSWSLRAWLICEVSGLEYEVETTRFYCDAFHDSLDDYAPARTLPVLKLANGTIVADSLAIAEELAQRHPDAGLWPSDPDARAVARMITAEMHASFTALRSACPMNLRVAYSDFPASDGVLADLARIEALWDHARTFCREEGPWLFGHYTIADAFYAPVAARIAGYGLPLGSFAAKYVARHLAHQPFRQWRAMGLVDGPDQPTYAMPHATRAWPGPKPALASVSPSGPSVNESCPFTGKRVEHFLLFDGAIYGFASAFDRDKTAADPEAWPEFMRLTADRSP